MLAVIGSIATQQANPTKNTMKKIEQLLDYSTTHPDAIIVYHSIYMILAVHSNVSDISETNTRSRAGGHFFMSSDFSDPPNNGAILTIAQIIIKVVSSSSES